MPFAVSVCSLYENSSNIKLAAGLIAASWQSSHTQSAVDRGEYREKCERREKKSVGEKEKMGYEMQCHICSDPSTTVKCCCILFLIYSSIQLQSLYVFVWSLFSSFFLPCLCDLTLTICVSSSRQTPLWFFPHVVSFLWTLITKQKKLVGNEGWCFLSGVFIWWWGIMHDVLQ